MNKNIVFIHGFMNTGDIWNQWITLFKSLGYTCYAPTWINHSKQDSEDIKAATSFEDVLLQYVHFIDSLDTKPILIGHSLGGIIVQKLINMDKGAAGITIASGPANNIAAFNLDWLISNLKMLGPFSKDPILMDKNWYNKYVTNELSMSDTEKFMKANCIRSSKLIPKTINRDGHIDFNKEHAPLLFISGDRDKSQPPIIQLKNVKAYSNANGIVDYHVFNGKTHNIVAQNGWQEVAMFINSWIDSLNIFKSKS
ncbi:alpha/beta hydrolase [Nicoliella lavandulae]|uniref:Alpha/beta hydrolase n=1 Tax=Nicoliella lavandulae TaxID=3082954 RepID=A0ABU8SMP0_9LACO